MSILLYSKWRLILAFVLSLIGAFIIMGFINAAFGIPLTLMFFFMGINLSQFMLGLSVVMFVIIFVLVFMLVRGKKRRR